MIFFLNLFSDILYLFYYRFKRDNACLLENNQKTQLCASAVAQWLSFRLQMIGVLLVSGVGLLTVIQHHLDHAEPGKLMCILLTSNKKYIKNDFSSALFFNSNKLLILT